MKQVIEPPKDIIKQMADDKKRVIDYLQSGDEANKPAGIKFVKPAGLLNK